MAIEPSRPPEQNNQDPRSSFFSLVQERILDGIPLRRGELHRPEVGRFNIELRGFIDDEVFKRVWLTAVDSTEEFFIPNETLGIEAAHHLKKGQEPIYGEEAVVNAEVRLRELLGINASTETEESAAIEAMVAVANGQGEPDETAEDIDNLGRVAMSPDWPPSYEYDPQAYDGQ